MGPWLPEMDCDGRIPCLAGALRAGLTGLARLLSEAQRPSDEEHKVWQPRRKTPLHKVCCAASGRWELQPFRMLLADELVLWSLLNLGWLLLQQQPSAPA
jgi:hypothetical protein